MAPPDFMQNNSSSETPEDQSLGRSSTPRVLETPRVIETRTFLLTVSTRDPVTQECQQSIVQYARANTEYAYIVTETGQSGKLHLHAVLVFNAHKERKKLQENITNRYVKSKGHADAKNGLAVKVQVCPGHRWYDEYLRKESGVTVLLNNYDRDRVTEFFPTEAVQEFLQVRSSSGGFTDKYYTEHERRWIEQYPDDASYESALQYIKERMYVKRDMIVISDKRRLTQFAFALYEYRNHIITPNVEELNHGNRMTGNFIR